MDKGMDDDLDDLEEVEYLEDMEDAEVTESAPPYPGHPLDYGGKDMNQAEMQAPPYTVNVAYAVSSEPGLKTGVNNPYFQAGKILLHNISHSMIAGGFAKNKIIIRLI